MATLQNIRNRSGLLLAVIGIAMLAFILGDLLKSTNSGSGNINIGQVLGEDISIQVFQKKLDETLDNWKLCSLCTFYNTDTCNCIIKRNGFKVVLFTFRSHFTTNKVFHL